MAFYVGDYITYMNGIEKFLFSWSAINGAARLDWQMLAIKINFTLMGSGSSKSLQMTGTATWLL